MKTIMVFFLLILSLPVFGEEPKVYTDYDLEGYKGAPTYDEETLARRSADLDRWEKERQNEEILLRDKAEGDFTTEQERKVSAKSTDASEKPADTLKQGRAKGARKKA